MDAASLSIDGSSPHPVARPTDIAELGEVIRSATVVYPVGGGTALGIGRPPTRPGTVVATSRLDRVIDYPARDMTVTVQAGITLARLDELLRGENQRLAVDVPLPAHATLGGAIAANLSGPRRFGLGTLRDYVIGINAVNDEGREFKAGGRVVKNVAGYDICKLLVGSLGTLGIVTQATLKLKPRPEDAAAVVLGCAAGDLAVLLETLHATRTRPIAVEALNRAAVREAGMPLPDAEWVVVVAFEEKIETTAWQVRTLKDELARGSTAEPMILDRTATERLLTALTDARLGGETLLRLKVNLLPNAVPSFCRKVAELRPDAAIQAHAGSGIVLIRVTTDLTPAAARSMLNELLPLATAAAGNVVVEGCPPAWKADLPVWGAPRGDLAVMRAVRTRFDPRGRFNPGRFLID